MSQPLADAGILWSTAWFCGIFGAVLGWLQVHNERRPDLWAFLIHRPMTRTGIFLGKAMAGLGLYALVVGLPLLGFIVWARLPGHVAAPFELAMLRPVAAYFLAGIRYYFAGMLSDLRQARWYASRVLGAGRRPRRFALHLAHSRVLAGPPSHPGRRGDSGRRRSGAGFRATAITAASRRAGKPP